MRPWRKLHAGITNSEKVAQVSDGAAFLFTLLIAAQDDAGLFPWTPAKVRALTASRPAWSQQRSNAFLKELEGAVGDDGRALVERTGIYVHIIDGETKNGQPSNAKQPMFYSLRDGECAPPSPLSQAHATAQPLLSSGSAVAQQSARPTESGLSKARVRSEREDQKDQTQSARARESEGIDLDDVGPIHNTDPFGENDLPPLGPAPRTPSSRPVTEREAYFTRFRERFTEGNHGRFGNASAAGQAWNEHVPPGEEEAVLAALDAWFSSRDFRSETDRGIVTHAATWLGKWRDWQPVAPKKARELGPVTLPNGEVVAA